jgi:hypothetical protein
MRVIPWFTDGAIIRINEILHQSKFKIFEFGGGSSTLYFLLKGNSVTTVDHNIRWVKKIANTAKCWGLEKQLTIEHRERPYASFYSEVTATILFDMVVVDGRDRNICVETVLNSSTKLPKYLIFDNSNRPKYKKSIDFIESCYDLKRHRQPFDLRLRRTVPDYFGDVSREKHETTIATLKTQQ